MPTYEYACTKCGHRLEAVQSFSDDPLTKCSECGGPLRKVYGNVGIVFKGSGFYKTDSRNGSGSKTSSIDSSGTESATKSEATPASSDAPAASKSDSTSPKKESTGSSSSGSSDGGKKDAKPAASKSS